MSWVFQTSLATHGEQKIKTCVHCGSPDYQWAIQPEHGFASGDLLIYPTTHSTSGGGQGESVLQTSDPFETFKVTDELSQKLSQVANRERWLKNWPLGGTKKKSFNLLRWHFLKQALWSVQYGFLSLLLQRWTDSLDNVTRMKWNPRDRLLHRAGLAANRCGDWG